MHAYRPSDPIETLEPWPFTDPASGYVVTQGTPQASGRIDTGGAGHTYRTGIWRCTAGAFECTEQSDELMTVLSGRCTITDHATQTSQTIGPGDTLFIREGQRVTWDVHEDVTKVFYGSRASEF